MEPTKEQIQWLWEQCGFEQLPWGKKDFHYEATVKTMNWTHPQLEYGTLDFLPRIDLSNLFEYPVSEVRKRCGVTKVAFSYFENTVVCSLMGGGGALQELFRSDLEQSEKDALFRVCYKALGGKE